VRGVARTAEEARRAERMVVVEKCILTIERLNGLLDGKKVVGLFASVERSCDNEGNKEIK